MDTFCLCAILVRRTRNCSTRSNYFIFCMDFPCSHIRRLRVRPFPPLGGVRLGEPAGLLGNCCFEVGWVGTPRLHVVHGIHVRGLLDYFRVRALYLPP